MRIIQRSITLKSKSYLIVIKLIPIMTKRLFRTNISTFVAEELPTKLWRGKNERLAGYMAVLTGIRTFFSRVFDPLVTTTEQPRLSVTDTWRNGSFSRTPNNGYTRSHHRVVSGSFIHPVGCFFLFFFFFLFPFSLFLFIFFYLAAVASKTYYADIRCFSSTTDSIRVRLIYRL